MNTNQLTSRSANYISYSGAGMVKIVFNGLPTAPTISGTSSELSRVTLSWSAPASPLTISDYIVQYRLGSSGSWSTFSDGTSGTPGAVVTGLSAGSAYQFQVAAVTSDGTGPYSSPVSVTVNPDFPATFATAADVPLTINGLTATGAALTLNLGFAPGPLQKLTLVNNTGTNAITGTFTGLAQNGTVTGTYNGDTFTFQINYSGGTGNDITLMRVGGPGQTDIITVSTLAGSTAGFTNATGPAAQFNNLQNVALDSAGNLYVADYGNHQIRKVTPAGVVTTLAGTNTPGTTDGTGSAARFNGPAGVAVDASGNVYVADRNNYRIRKVTPAGVVTTLAGNTNGFADATGTSALFNVVTGVAVDAAGNVYVADPNNHRIRKVTSAGVVTTLAGTNTTGTTDATGSAARFSSPYGVAVDSAGNVYVTEVGNARVRKVTPAGVVTTLAGSTSGFADGTGSAAQFGLPNGMAVDSAGNVYVADYSNHRIRKVTQAGVVTTLAGSTAGATDGTGSAAQLSSPTGLALDSAGNFYVGDSGNHRVRKITADFRPILTLGASSQGVSGLSLNGTVNPNGYVTTARFEYGTNATNLNLFTNLALSPSNGTTAQNVTALFGTNLPVGTYHYRLTASNVDGSVNSATNSFIQLPRWDNAGAVTFATAATVPVTAPGLVIRGATLNPTLGFLPRPGTALTLVNNTSAMAIDGTFNGLAEGGIVGLTYNGDTFKFKISYVGGDGNDITLVRTGGQAQIFTLTGSAAGSDNGASAVAKLSNPLGVVVDRNGNTYVADTANHQIRKITEDGTVSVLAGSTQGYQNATGSAAQFNGPQGVAVDTAGNVYVADTANSRIRKITPAGVVTLLAGSGTPGNTDGTGAAASFNLPQALTVDAAGNVYVSDTGNHRIRKITSAGVVTTLAGSTQGYLEGTGTAARFNTPNGIVVDAAGNVYVADTNNARIRKISPAGLVTTFVDATGGLGSNFGGSSSTGNMIRNGDFSDGTNSFTSEYTYVAPVSSALNPEGRWSIVSAGRDVHNAFSTAFDHTLGTSSGKFFAGNGAPNTNQTVWRSSPMTILEANTPYRFEAWVTTLVSVSGSNVGPSLSFEIGDGNNWTPLGTSVNFTSANTAGSWVFTYADGSFGQPGIYYLRLRNAQAGAMGNDFGIDDIFFGVRSTSPSYATVPGAANPPTYNVSGLSGIYLPVGLALDSSGNLYVSDAANSKIRQVTPSGTVSVFAGSTAGFADGAANIARFSLPAGLAFDAGDSLYIADAGNHRIRKSTFDFRASAGISAVTQTPTGAVVTGLVNPNGLNTVARIEYGTSPSYGLTSNITLSPINGEADQNFTNTLAPLTPGLTYYYRLFSTNADGASFFEGSFVRNDYSPVLTLGPATLTSAGAQLTGTVNPQGLATTARFEYGTTTNFGSASVVNFSPNNGTNALPVTNNLTGLTAGATYHYRLSATNADGGRVTQTGTFERPVEWNVDPVSFATATNVPATSTGLVIPAATALNLQLGFAPASGTILTVLNNTGSSPVFGTFDGLAEGATVSATQGGDTFHFRLSYQGGDGNDITLTRIGGPGQVENVIVSTLAGGGSYGNSSGSSDGTGSAALFYYPYGVAVDRAGNVYVTDTYNHQIRKITPAGVVTTLAGSTSSGTANGTGTSARFNRPAGITLDASGNLYVADQYNNLIRKISPTGVVTTLAGSGSYGSGNGTGTAASFAYPSGVGVDSQGNVYIGDSLYSIRKITPVGVVTTLAGGSYGSTDGTGLAARFNTPKGITLDGAGNLYVAEDSHRIRKITPAGVVTTFAGSSYGLVDGPALSAKFYGPNGVTSDALGNLYVADTSNHRIRKIAPDGTVSTLAGSGTYGGNVDGPGNIAQFSSPSGIASGADGALYVADNGNNKIRKITSDYRPILTLGAPVQTGTNMSLPGTVNPNGFLTTARFEYGTNATNLNLTSPVALAPANGTNAQAVNALLTNGITMQVRYTYRLTASNVDGTAVTTNGTFTLRLPQTITFGALPAKTYGDPEFAVTPPNSDVPNQSYLIALTSSDSNVVAVGGYSSSPTLIVRSAGTAVITARHPGSTTLAPAEASQSITVAKRALTARAVDYSAFAGQTLPAFRISYSGFTPSDDASVLDVAPILSTTATASSPAGTYPLTLSSSTDNNYTVSTANGTLTLVASGGPFPVFSRFDAPVVATNYTASGNLNFTLGYAPRPYEVLPLVDNRGTNAVTGTFSGRAEGARVSASFGPDTFEFELSYRGGDGNDITLTRLPKSGQTAGSIPSDIAENPKEYWVTTLAGSGSTGFSEGAGPDARFSDPHGLLLEPNGGLLVADRGANRILHVGTFGRVTSFAGSGASASTDGPAATAGIRAPVDLARDASNNLYVLQNAKVGNWDADVRIRKITPAGAVTTLAGGASGYQDGSGTNAKFSTSTFTLVADSAGNLFVADAGNHRIRKITPAGVVSTFAGSGSSSGTNNGTGTAANLANPTGIAIDNADNLYVSDANGKLRIISPAGVVTTETSERTVAYYSGWNASNATFYYSSVEAFWGSFAGNSGFARMAFDASTNVYTSNAILSLSPRAFWRYLPTNLAETNLIGVGALRAKKGSYALFAGDTNQAFSDGLLATSGYSATNNVSQRQLDPRATFSDSLRGLARDRFGNIYISDAGNKRIRKLSPGVFRPISPTILSFPELLAQSPNPGDYSLDYQTNRSVSSVVQSNGYSTTGSFELYRMASNGAYSYVTTLPASNNTSYAADATNFSARYTNLAPGAYASALVISNVDGIVHSGLQAYFNVVALPSPKTNQTITFAPLTNRIYGEVPFTLGATSSSGLPITYVSGNPSIVSISGDQATILGAGTVNLTARQPGNSTYNAAPEVSQSLTVLKRPLTVIANNTNRFFGQPNGSFSVSFSGFAPGDNAGNSVSGTAGYRTSSGAFPSATTTPGSYDLIPELGSLSSSKYDFIIDTNTPAVLTINPAPVLITLGNLSPTFQVSGGTPVQQAASVTTQPAGLNHSVMYTGINGSLYGPSSTPPTDPGQYRVVVNVADTGYAGSTTNTLTIGKATQTLTLSGLLSSVPLKDLTNALSITAVSSAGLPVNISLEPDSAQATLNSVTNSGAGSLSNFAQTGTVKLKISATGTEFYHAASTVVTMDVTLAAQSITFNQNLSNLTYSNGLTVNLTGTSSSGLDLTYSSSNTNVATVSSNVLSITGAGTVSVEATQAGNGVYDAATPVTQTFTVAKAAAPALGFSLAGLNTVYGQGTVDLSSYVTTAPVGVSRTFEVISGPATISGNTLTITGAGPILIRASQPETDNYLGATAMDQTLNVARATLHITAVNTNRPAGQANPVFAVTYSNLVAGDTAASLASPAVVTTLADETSSAGTYPLEVDGAGSDNYDIFFVDGVLTVTKANPAISWDLTGADTITYGTALGTSQLNATAPVAGTFNYSPASGSILPAGTNQVVATFTPTDTSSYETISVTNNIIVNKATVLVVANAQTKYAGQSDPELTYSALGLVGSDTFTGALGRPSGETPGTYAISQGTLEVAGGAAGNYTIQFTPANLTILVDSLGLISAYDGSQTGSAIPALVNYTDLGITGVTSSNLLAINSAIARLDAAVTDSVEEIQAVVNAFGQILAGADGNASTPPGGLNLSAGIYQTVGVVLGDIATNANNLFLYNSIISSRSVGDVDSAQELDTLADVVNRLQDYAAGTPPTPAVTMGDLSLIGVSLSGLTNLTSDLAPFYSALEATADDGSGLLTVAAVQALLTSYEKILAEANGASADATAQDPLPSDYTAIGVNLGTIGNVGYGLDLLNDLVAGLAKTAVDTVPELNALASVIDRILITVAGGTASPALTDADFTLIGISGVTANNLGAVLAGLAGTADNGEDVASIAALQGVVDGAADALGKISQYDTGDTGADVPTTATYLAAGITGVDAGNLAAINTALAELAPSASDTRVEVQAAVDAYLKILGEANGAVADATPSGNPTAGDYAAIGVDLGATATNASGLGLLNEVIGGKNTTDVDTVAEIQALADVVDKILATAAGTPPSPALTQAELASLGLTGVTANNLNAILAALAGTDDSGSGVATVAQIQSLVDGVNITYASNALAIISAYQPPTVTVVPTVSDYAEAGVSGVNLANLATFNSAMAVLGSSATDTTAEVQAVVNTYFKILAEANGATADPDPSSNPTVADYQTIGVSLGGLAGSLSGFSLFSDVVGASEYEDIDTVPELDALASVADRLLTVAGGGVASPALTAADLALIGITGVTSGNLADVLLAVGATADDGSSISTLAGLQAVVDTMVNALAKISTYDGSQTGSAVPSLQTFADALVYGVTANNLPSVNSALARLASGASDTSAEIQAVVSGYARILAEANGLQPDAYGYSNPTADDYLALGVPLGSAAVNPNGLALLNEIVGNKITTEVDTVAELDALASAVDRLIQTAGGQSFTPPLAAADFVLIGITGVNSSNLAAILTAIGGTADDGSAIDTLAELQAVVTNAAQAFGASALPIISSYDGTGGTTAPDENHYGAAGVNGVTAGNVAAINTAIGPLPSSATDSSAEIQAVVDAYLAILDEANGSLADANASANPSSTDYQTIGVNLGAAATNVNGLDLLNTVVGAKEDAGVDTVSEIQGLATAVDGLLTLAGGGTPSPAVDEATLGNLGISGATSGNLASILSAITASPDNGSGIASLAQLQAVVDGYAAILGAADGTDDNDTKPTAGDYAAVQITGIDTSGEVSLLGDVVDEKNSSAVDTVAELQTLADAVQAVLGGTPSQAQLEALLGTGTGLTSGNLPAVQAAIAAAAPAGADTLAELATLVDGVVNAGTLALNRIRDAAQNNTAAGTNPSATDFATAGVTGVDVTNLAAIQSALNDADVIGTSADTTVKIQGIVDAYLAILGAADGSADGDTAPTAVEYGLIGVNGVSGASAVALLGNVIDGKTGVDVDTVTEVQGLADFVAAVMNGAAGTANQPSLADLQGLGISGVNSTNLAAVQAAIAATANDGSDVDSLAKLQAVVNSGVNSGNALAVISGAADANNATDNTSSGRPNLSDYATAGVTGVDATNLPAINSALNTGGVDAAKADTTAEVQAIVDAYLAILGVADGTAGNGTAPTAAQYSDIGVTGVTAGASAELLGNVVDGSASTAVDTVVEIQALADAVARVMAGAAGTANEPTLADLTALGITGVDSTNLALIQAAIAATAANGSDVDSLSKLQTLVDGVLSSISSALATISGAAENDNATSTSLAASVYESAAVTGVDVTNVGAINSVLDLASVNGAAVNTTAEIQAIVDAYQAILGAADGSADGDPAPTGVQYAQIGVTGVATAEAVSLLGEVIDAKSGGDVDSVTEVQNLADAVAGVLAGAGGTANEPTLADLTDLGFSSVNSSNLADVQAAIAAAGVAGVDTLSELQSVIDSVVGVGNALAAIADAAENNTAVSGGLTVAVYTAAGVTGVDANNVAAINSALDSALVTGADTTTTADVQAIVDAYVAVLGLANGSGGTNPGNFPAASAYGSLGVSGVTAGASADLLGSVIDEKLGTDVDTVAELQDLADAVKAVLDYASGASATAPTLSQLQLLGVTGLSTGSVLDGYLAALLAGGSSGADSLAELQAVEVWVPVETKVGTVTEATAPATGVTVNFVGTPGQAYRLSATSALEAPISWSAMGMQTADGTTGVMTVTDPGATPVTLTVDGRTDTVLRRFYKFEIRIR